MRHRRRRVRRWRALVVVEVMSVVAIWLLSRASTLIGDVHDEADDERAATGRRAAKGHRRRGEHVGGLSDDRLAQ